MGKGLSVFAVPQEELARAFGRGDAMMRDEALKALDSDLRRYDEQMNDPDDDGTWITHADALREIFTGNFSGADNNAAYGWAFECLCNFLGVRLDNSDFMPCSEQWYAELDEVLARYDVPLRLVDLISKAPVPIPESEEWPLVGHWPASAMAAAMAPLAMAAGSPVGSDVNSALSTAVTWVRLAASRPGTVVVGFHG